MKVGALLLGAALVPAAFAACATSVDPIGGYGGEGADAGGSGGSGGITSTGTGLSTGTGGPSTGTGGTSDSCGDGKIDPGETCDPPASCPTTCNDGDACTSDTLTGSAAACNAACAATPVTACLPDGCCPAGCNTFNDPDCTGCGNGVAEGNEQCDDGNLVNGDGCSSGCTLGNANSFGPVHTFANMSSSFYVTQFGCSNSGGDPAGDALWFCQHFYNASCTAQPVWQAVQSSSNPMMHSGTNCNSPDPNGTAIPNTVCIGGPCKIGNYQGPLGGLTNLVCDCP